MLCNLLLLLAVGGFWYFGLKTEGPLEGVSTPQLQINL